MSFLPRLAIGSLHPEHDQRPIAAAVVHLLSRHVGQVQVFHDRARFCGRTCVPGLDWQDARFLDSWQMSRQLCRESFAYAMRQSDMALVSGRFGAASTADDRLGGSLELLGEWLDLPRIALVDGSQWSDCRAPRRPEGADAILLDRVRERDVHRIRTWLEPLWGVPVLGALPPLESLRAALVGEQRGSREHRAVAGLLADHLAKHVDVARLIDLSRRSFSPPEMRIYVPGEKLAGLHVAVACDEAFHGYFPEELELLELHGAQVSDFSPLDDERLPDRADVVYLGCGRPHEYADRLAANDCLKLALHEHVRRGRRVYAEGGGAAYLAQQLVLSSGRCLPMAGVLPATAYYASGAKPAHAAEVVLREDHWLGPVGTLLRGYLNPNWLFAPAGALHTYSASAGCRDHLLGANAVIASRMNINFAAQPDFLRRFSSPVPQMATSPLW